MHLRNKIIFFVTIFLACLFISGEVQDNPSEPHGIPGLVPGRSLKIKEVLRITDEKGDFIFRSPRVIRIAGNGHTFVRGREQVLEFSLEGKYLRNFVKKGEGPGEIIYLSDFYLTDKSLIIGTLMPVKIIHFNFEGELTSEFRVEAPKPICILLGGWKDRLFFNSSLPGSGDDKTGIDRRENIMFMVGSGRKVKPIDLKFDTLDLMIKISSKEGIMINMDEWTRLLTEFDENGNMYVVHTSDYLVKQVNLDTIKITREFRRDYKSVDYREKTYTDEMDKKLYALRKREKFNDIYAITTFDRKVLIFTSTMNEKGEVLVDVFDWNGIYMDKFFIKVPGVKRPDDLIRKPLLFHKGFFWTSDVDEDDAPYLIKFRLEGKI